MYFCKFSTKGTKSKVSNYLLVDSVCIVILKMHTIKENLLILKTVKNACSNFICSFLIAKNNRKYPKMHIHRKKTSIFSWLNKISIFSLHFTSLFCVHLAFILLALSSNSHFIVFYSNFIFFFILKLRYLYIFISETYSALNFCDI